MMETRSLILVALLVMACGCVSTLRTPLPNSEEALTAPSGNGSSEVEAVVARVIDGDTVQLTSGQTVRLLGINAPEEGEPYYSESRSRLRELVEGKRVSLEQDAEDRDRFGRLLRYVISGRVNVNVEMVMEGLASVYTTTVDLRHGRALMEAEAEARGNGVGLWTVAKTTQDPCQGGCIRLKGLHWNAAGNDCQNLNDEYFVLENLCAESCNMTWWSASDESSRPEYVFPPFSLASGAEVAVYTGCGVDTQDELYWCSSGYSCNAIWNNDGDTLYLRNEEGLLVLREHYAGF